jgi:hypothetical protein
MAKVVVDIDGLDYARDCFGSERSNAWRHESITVAEVLPQLVIEISNAVGLRGFGLGRHDRHQCGWYGKANPSAATARLPLQWMGQAMG